MGYRKLVHSIFNKFGFDFHKYPINPESLTRRRLFFKSMSFDTVIDVGANSGQFAEYLRKHIHYNNRIFSFEPLSSAFTVLNAKAEVDPKWSAYNFALGEKEMMMEINIAGNSFSSSFLDMLPEHLNSAPKSKYIAKERVEVKTLDSINGNLFDFEGKVFLKIDTQGYEKQVLLGAKYSMKFFNTIQLEMSLLPLYRGESLFEDSHSFLKDHGFSLIDIESGFADPATGKLLQVDGFYQRSSFN